MGSKKFIAIDSHCHAGESWYEPIKSLVFHLEENQINKAVLIGHMGAYENNNYLLECKKNFPDRFSPPDSNLTNLKWENVYENSNAHSFVNR